MLYIWIIAKREFIDFNSRGKKLHIICELYINYTIEPVSLHSREDATFCFWVTWARHKWINYIREYNQAVNSLPSPHPIFVWEDSATCYVTTVSRRTRGARHKCRNTAAASFQNILRLQRVKLGCSPGINLAYISVIFNGLLFVKFHWPHAVTPVTLPRVGQRCEYINFLFAHKIRVLLIIHHLEQTFLYSFGKIS